LANRFTIDLSPRVALVTGGSRGIGRAAARLLAAAGARVVVGYARDARAAASAVDEIRAAGGEAVALEADVADPAAARRLVAEAAAAWGRLDFLINNAGVWPENPAGSGDLAAWDLAFAVNTRGVFVATDAAIPHLEKTRGTIVFVSSTAGQRGEARHSAYAASKGAIISYTKSLATELGPRGIRVNCVAPGWVDTDMSAASLDDPAERRAIESLIPIGRIASADDAAGPILFLVSDLARHLQGEIVNVNGGSVLAG
jgi:3-oxoacyl-[acyl-carrier protein] reductase